jgi:hypothetical protein
LDTYVATLLHHIDLNPPVMVAFKMQINGAPADLYSTQLQLIDSIWQHRTNYFESVAERVRS